MKKFVSIFLLFITIISHAQYSADSIKTDFVLHENRVKFKQYLIDKTVNETFLQPLDSNTEFKFEDACWSISQFALQSSYVEVGFAKMFAQYDSLEYGTRRAFLEAVYASYIDKYENNFKQLISKETFSKLFAMEALYLYRNDRSTQNVQSLETLMQQRFPQYDSVVILHELKNYLDKNQNYIQQPTPDILQLFSNQKKLNQKIIYSFQRWNRDYAGIAIIQNADGSFVKDKNGKLITVEQLARSGSDLPYFITNGNTPQGIFSIQGVQVDANHIIGPTPTIQLVMPFEAEDSLYWHNNYDTTKDELGNYLNLLPDSWKNYQPIIEAFYAGKIGRTEIIAHGTTLDPEYFSGKPFYPISPTMGCLCAKEDWNIFTGKFISSEQFNLVNAFLSTPINTGFLMVINLDDQQKAVTENEIEDLVKRFENRK
jgi:hypothetical protein